MNRWVAIAVLSPLLACGTGGHAEGPDAGPSADCSADPRVSAYAPGMRATSPDRSLVVVLQSSDPAPPARGTNRWVVQALDGAGQPRTGPLAVQAFMPDHGHGPSVVPSATLQADGTYAVAPLSFFMPGVWRVTLSPADGGAASGAPLFLCIQG